MVFKEHKISCFVAEQVSILSQRFVKLCQKIFCIFKTYVYLCSRKNKRK